VATLTGSKFMRTFRHSASLFLLCFSLLAASQVRADSLSYVYQFDGNTFAWVLPTNPVISPSNVVPSSSFTIPDVSFTENNGAPTVGTVDFFNSSNFGGFDLYVGNFDFLSDAEGPQLYSGPEGGPTLLTGTFSLTEFGNVGTPIGTGTLQVTPVQSIPEPSTILLLATGFAIGLVFTLLRKI
jgi:hypothetical protein